MTTLSKKRKEAKAKLPKDPLERHIRDVTLEHKIKMHEFECPGFVITTDEDKFFIYGVCSDCETVIERHAKM
jgi:hypothetical protein